VPTWLPTPGNLRLRRAIRRLDDIVYGILAERPRDEDRGDLLSTLLLARDDGRPLSDRQVRDEVMTLLLAGHETTALALTWAWLLLDRTPDVRRQLEAELDDELDGRIPTADDLPRLPYTAAVVNEVLRLYPPAYVTGREAVRETTLAGVRLPKRHVVLVAMAVIHRDPRFYPDPDAFRPERWLDGLEKRLPRGAFVPFGLGGRKCIGASFAVLEASLLLATIAQRIRIDVAPGEVPVQPAITLRPRGPIPAVARARRSRRTATERGRDGGRLRSISPG
jgi:cytochrome P450